MSTVYTESYCKEAADDLKQGLYGKAISILANGYADEKIFDMFYKSIGEFDDNVANAFCNIAAEVGRNWGEIEITNFINRHIPDTYAKKSVAIGNCYMRFGLHNTAAIYFIELYKTHPEWSLDRLSHIYNCASQLCVFQYAYHDQAIERKIRQFILDLIRDEKDISSFGKHSDLRVDII